MPPATFNYNRSRYLISLFIKKINRHFPSLLRKAIIELIASQCINKPPLKRGRECNSPLLRFKQNKNHKTGHGKFDVALKIPLKRILIPSPRERESTYKTESSGS